MPRHSLSSSRTLGRQTTAITRDLGAEDPTIWKRMDRAQVLGTPSEGHRGCVNALSWSDDGSTLLSGSDDKRICIWAGDPEAHNSVSPHPLKLVETIATGHRANIFSAKYLPNTNTPTIVSCAGDRDVRVFEVERLGTAPIGPGNSEELYGVEGPGVLRCHYDRTKRIATENSPFLFLTVSEDGSVRQHDLRRPHTCRSECPEPLFRAPRGIDLYSLSVSTVTPHIFAVAGRTDVAYVCDRRMTERQTPSWGNQTKESGQVNCVRRLGLSNDDWESMGVVTRGPFSEDRHITCVKMSPEHADEVICAFAQHSTSLFSLYDSPPSNSMRHRSSSAASSSHHKAPPTSSVSNPPPGRARKYTASDFERSPRLGKRRTSQISSLTNPANSRLRTGSMNGDHAESEAEAVDSESLPGATPDTLSEASLEAEDIASLRRVVEGDEDQEVIEDDGHGPMRDFIEDFSRAEVVLPVEDDMFAVLDGEDEDMGDRRELFMEDEDDDDDGMDEDLTGDESDEEVDDEDWDLDEEDELDIEGFRQPAMDVSELANVEMLLPKRSFKGARNMETVKDCNFLGTRSDKVCSGSDDGNFFVWDKDTGRLDGIWEGDGHVVNVMEQHPTLPIVAVSGIDNTVKIFSPLSKPLPRSFSRLHLSESIIRANTDRTSFQPSSAFGNASILQFLADRGIQATFAHGGEDDEDGEPQCTTQ